MTELGVLYTALAMLAGALVAGGIAFVRAQRAQAQALSKIHGDLAAHWRYMRLRAAALEARLDDMTRTEERV